jgi:hypothetical protein
MYLVINSLNYDASKLHIFLTKANAFKYLKTLEHSTQYVILDVNLKVINDLKDFVSNLFKVEKRIIEPELVQEPVVESAVAVETMIIEPTTGEVIEPMPKPKRKYVKKAK